MNQREIHYLLNETHAIQLKKIKKLNLEMKV